MSVVRGEGCAIAAGSEGQSEAPSSPGRTPTSGGLLGLGRSWVRNGQLVERLLERERRFRGTFKFVTTLSSLSWEEGAGLDARLREQDGLVSLHQTHMSQSRTRGNQAKQEVSSFGAAALHCRRTPCPSEQPCQFLNAVFCKRSMYAPSLSSASVFFFDLMFQYAEELLGPLLYARCIHKYVSAKKSRSST